MERVSLAEVLAAVDPVAARTPDGWGCAVYLSAFDWMRGWRRDADLSLQSEMTKKWLNRQRVSRRVLTIRNRNASRNVRAAFDELLAAVENRRANAVVVADIAYFATSFSEARFFVKEVFKPMGVRFIDVANKFDSTKHDAGKYLQVMETEYSCERRLLAEIDRLREGRLTRTSVPYGYVYDEGAEGFVRPDEETARFVPRIFELVAADRWWAGKLVEQVRSLGCPGPLQCKGRVLDGGCWDIATIRNLVKNPFYMGVFDPSFHASSRMRSSGLDLDGFGIIEGHHAPLVSRDLFLAANEGLRRNFCACPTETEGRRPRRG